MLRNSSRGAPGVPHLLPPQQRLLDKVDLAAHCETTLPAQPFSLIQFMPQIKMSLGSPPTAANICRELDEGERGEEQGGCTAISRQSQAAACSQPAPALLSSPLARSQLPAAATAERSTVPTNSSPAI